ncbi:MAG: hypothetical protein HFI88_08225 [Lachnospiraceae bacterium]|nr:hypothetical protein [Lachnospiraceae bacterium]
MKIEVECIQILKEASEGQLNEKACGKLRALNRACVQSGLQMVRQKDIDNLDSMLKGYRRLRRTMAGLPKEEREEMFYECGIFNGMYKVFEEINIFFVDQERHRNTQKVLGRKHVPEILDYLYLNPNARQRSVAQGVDIAPNYLSELLNLLLDTGFIERYGKNKDTCYCLTKKGRIDYATRRMSRKRTVHIEIELREIREKERFFQTRFKDSEIKREISYGKWKDNFQNDAKAAGGR